tara:strand:- start:287 stop:1438 length:1152 start_codon:yes stop_codon:yes gene_type:complete
MANVIKLKRGTSTPTTSNIVDGEVAIDKSAKKFFLNDGGTIKEIGGIPDSSVTSAKIADGAIVNADINASAAIAGTKISPDFGSQTIATTGVTNLSGELRANANIKITNAGPKISLVDSNNDDDFEIKNNDGVFTVRDATNSDDRLTIASDGTTDITNNLNVGAGLDVTGDITGTGNLALTSTDSGSSAAPELELYRNSSSPADADYLGQLKFTGESDDGSKEVYAKITGKISDASSGTEDGIIEVAHRKAGSNVITARFTSTSLKLINGTELEAEGGATITGTCTATTFSGSGASLTSLPAGQLTGTLPAIDGSNLTNLPASGGPTGGGSDKIFTENAQAVTTNYTIGDTFGAACNAMAAGPITVNSGVTVTVNSGETLTIV